MKLFNTLKSIDPTPLIALVLTFVVAFMLGQRTTKDASEVEVVHHNPYKALALDGCVTDYECNIVQLLDDQAPGPCRGCDDPIFFPDSVPVIEPIDCETGDKECEKANKLNAGKSAHYPSICEPYIFPNEHKERTP